LQTKASLCWCAILTLVTVTNGPNQSLELTATRREFTFQMIKTLLLRANRGLLAAASGGSAPSR